MIRLRASAIFFGKFQSTRPARGATIGLVSTIAGCRNFNPRAPRGARRDNITNIERGLDNFNPRAPRGARRVSGILIAVMLIFQSTRPARGATTAKDNEVFGYQISIHAPREGRDYRHARHAHKASISIHAPREGRDAAGSPCSRTGVIFQSTRPARGATMVVLFWRRKVRNFNPRAPRGARRSHIAGLGVLNDFNPRAPRGARRLSRGGMRMFENFNPRAPRGARPYPGNSRRAYGLISIHAPREGRDQDFAG